MKNLAWIGPVLCAVLAGCGETVDTVEATRVEQAWVRLPAGSGQPGAAYFTVRGEAGTVLIGVGSPKAGRIELHETRTEGGIARMAAVPRLPIPDDGALRFAPGGKHAMLFGIDPEVRPGDRIPLTFSFDPPFEVTAEAEVRGPAGNRAHNGH
jgi:copper(I)-binding protein